MWSDQWEKKEMRIVDLFLGPLLILMQSALSAQTAEAAEKENRKSGLDSVLLNGASSAVTGISRAADSYSRCCSWQAIHHARPPMPTTGANIRTRTR